MRRTHAHASIGGALAVAAASFLLGLHPVRAEEPVNPQIGNVVYRAEIRSDARGQDTDEYGGRLLVGETLDVEVESPGQSPLYPLIEIAGPDGVPRPVTVRSDPAGRRLRVKKLPVDASGEWVVRVRGFASTRGRYSIRFRVGRAPPAELEVPAGAAGAGADSALPFQALDGAALRLRWSWNGAVAPTLASLTDPSGADVPSSDGEGTAAADAVRVAGKRRTSELVVEALGEGDGTYLARFASPPGHGEFRASAEIVPAGRPRGRRKLHPVEPWIAPRDEPLRIAAGLRVRIVGEGFAVPGGAPRVLFGDAEGIEPRPDEFGTYIEVEPPPAPDGSTVRVAVINPDGQGFARDGYFYYVPAPTVTGLEDRSGAPVVGGSTAGGLPIRIRGTNFQSGVLVRIGSSPVIVPQLLSDRLMEVRTPPQPAGEVTVRIEDSYAHDAVVPGTFEYKDPPRFGSSPYVPPAAAGNFDSVVALLGEDFQSDDVVLLDGVATQTAYASPTQLAFVVPAGPTATISVSIRDRVGTVVDGPSIQRVTITFP